jgi:mycothiol system anti-sigma-R factor
MNCREALKHLYDYLDNELNESVVKKIKAHLSTCEHCFGKFEFEKLLQAFVSEKGKLTVDAEPLKVRVMERIAEIDASSNSSGLFRRFRPYLAAVAAVIVTVVGLYSFLGQSDSTVLAADVKHFLTNHKECIEDMLSGAHETMTLDQIDSCFADAIRFPEKFFASHSDRDATLGLIETIGDHVAGHMMFDYRENDISVYVLPDEHFAVPDGLKPVKHGNHEYHIGSLDGLNIMLWQCQGLWCVAVSDLGVDDMMTFASSY